MSRLCGARGVLRPAHVHLADVGVQAPEAFKHTTALGTVIRGAILDLKGQKRKKHVLQLTFRQKYLD